MRGEVRGGGWGCGARGDGRGARGEGRGAGGEARGRGKGGEGADKGWRGGGETHEEPSSKVCLIVMELSLVAPEAFLLTAVTSTLSSSRSRT